MFIRSSQSGNIPVTSGRYDSALMTPQSRLPEVQSPVNRPQIPTADEQLRAQLAVAQALVRQLEAALSESLAEKARLQAQLTDAQTLIAQLLAENQRLQQEVTCA